MCRADSEDCVTVLTSIHRRARKVHGCEECHRIISPGERYHYETYQTEGNVIAHKTCIHCQVGRDWLIKNCGGYMYGEVLDEVREHAGDYPDLREPLESACAGINTKWIVLGVMMPIPTMPPAISVHEHH